MRGRAPRKHGVGKPASSLRGGFAEGPRKLAGGSFLISIKFIYLFFNGSVRLEVEGSSNKTEWH